eukprot:m.34954 g.34954  ORF g.34954 m.34954 type:complete len:225 (+) comp43826_c0_seq2:185-859(+)
MSDDEGEQGDSQFKIVLVGDGSSGKTSISKRFAQDSFGRDYQQTVGVDFFSKRVDISGGTTVTVSVWDIGGQSLGSQMLDKYFHGASAILFVYDITNANSFENLQDWFGFVVKHFATAVKKPYFGLIGNKCDLAHLRAVKLATHEEFAKQCRMGSFFVSAKTGDQVWVCFKRVISALTGHILTKADLELSAGVVRADIPEPEAGTVPVPAVQPRAKKSAICLLQ